MFFSIPLFENDNKKGRADIKVNQLFTLTHIVLFNIIKCCKYNIYFFIGKNGEKGIKKGYIISDRLGNFNNTIRFNKTENDDSNLFKETSLILITPSDSNINSNDIIGFKGEKFDYKSVMCTPKKSKEEYSNNEEYDKLINSSQEYWPFLSKIDNFKTIKINAEQFKNLNLNCIRENLKKYIDNSLKFYGFIIFGKCVRDNKSVYVIGIPDKYNPTQVISMSNMGANKFYGINNSKSPQTGDLGFWCVYI